MTKKDLVKIIREVVKIEVKKQVKEILIKENRSSSNLKSLVKPTAKKRVVKKKKAAKKKKAKKKRRKKK